MPVIRHDFSEKIIQTVRKNTVFDEEEILEKSSLLKYLNIKTKAAECRGR